MRSCSCWLHIQSYILQEFSLHTGDLSSRANMASTHFCPSTVITSQNRWSCWECLASLLFIFKKNHKLIFGGAIRETYRNIRGVDDHDTVMDNIRQIRDRKKKKGVETPVLFLRLDSPGEFTRARREAVSSGLHH